MKINSKVYYLIATGDVLVSTGEVETDGTPNTKEKDMLIYKSLQDKNIHEVDFIELEFGTMSATFRNSKSYYVDSKSKKLKVEYNTTEELQAIKNQEQEMETLSSRISDISTYLMDKKESITDVEDYILQNELNKTMEGLN